MLETRRLFSVAVKTASFGDGQFPLGSLVSDVAGNRYGISQTDQDYTSGGVSGGVFFGTIFEIPKGTNKIVTLATLNDNNEELSTSGMVVDQAGDFFYCTPTGIWELAVGSDMVAQVHLFGPNDGDDKSIANIDENGMLYGTTETSSGQSSSSFGGGTVFQINVKTLAFTTVATLDGVVNNGLIADSAGNLYGTTDGTVFEVAPQTGVVTTLATFNQKTSTDAYDLVVDPAGDIFGATALDFTPNGGGGGPASVFEIAAKTHKLTTVQLIKADTSGPFGRLYSDRFGNIYGTESNIEAADDDATNANILFEIPAGTHKLTTLADVSGASDQFGYPELFFDAAQNVYGATVPNYKNGKEFSGGAIFEVGASTHKLTTLIQFKPGSEGQPQALYAAGDGTLHGILGSDRSVFELTGLSTDPDPAQLVFAHQPKNTIAGKNIRPAVIVDIEDDTGKIIKTDNSKVEIAITSGSGSFSQTTVFMVNAVNGVATFSDLQLTLPDHYVLTASQIGSSGAQSQAFVIKPVS